MDLPGLRDLGLIAVVLASSVVALVQPVFGMLVFVLFAFLNPHSMTWTISRTFHPAQPIAIGTLVGYLLSSEPKRLPRQREMILLVVLWVIFGISTLFAVYPDRALDYLMRVSKILLMVFVTVALITSESRLHWLLRVIAYPLGFFALKGGTFAIVNGGAYMVWGPEDSFLYANNAIGLALAMNVPLLFCLLRLETRGWLRWLIRAMIVLSYPAVICTFSRGAWLGLAAATALIAWKARYRLLMIVAGAILAITIPAFTPQLPERVIARYEDLRNFQEEGSAQTRLWTWEFCRRVGLANPLTGAGFDFYSAEMYGIYYPEFLEWRGRVASCHSMWVTVFAEHGVIGGVLWLGLLGSCFGSLRRIRRHRGSESPPAWAVTYANMLQVALVTFAVTGSFVDIAYFDMYYYLVAIVVVLKERVSQVGAAIPSVAKVVRPARGPVVVPPTSPA